MMATDYSSTNNLRNKLDNLSINSSPEYTNDPRSKTPQQLSTKSLLSQSLADGAHGTNVPPQDRRLFYVEDLEQDISPDHPEPSLLATSVGNDHDGRLIPSSSTISLLSLNNNMNSGQFYTSHMEHSTGNKGPVVGFNNTNPERVNSYTNLRSRNSITHLGQQRLQPYHKMTSPIVPPVGEFTSISSPKNIPWSKNQMITPDSPNLHPTSIGESPSRFWLNAQTPPNSLAMAKAKNKFIGNGGLGLTPLHPINNERQPFPHTINITKGGDSPTLNPVQTPVEDMPMTPLYLSSEGGYFVSTNKGFGEKRMDYFFGYSDPVSRHDEREESDNDQDMD